jgi:polyisoprenoid-binding protein YceI
VRWFRGGSAWGTVKRSDFGMKTFLPAIGDEVDLIIEVEAKQKS